MNAPREHLIGRLQRADAPATAAYRRHEAQFADLSQRAAIALPSVALLAIAAYMLNARRRPVSAFAATTGRRAGRVQALIGRAALLRGPTAHAGFHFTLAALWRSSTHRLTLACCGAAGLAMSLVALSGIDVQDITSSGRAIPRLMIVQPFLMGMLLVGFRHTIRVPAELRANWGFQMAWRGHDRQFITGARRAALVGLVLPALSAVFVLDTIVLGPSMAAQHAMLGAAGAIVLLEALMLGYDKVPFTCSYLPNENMKALGPLYLLLFMIGASSFARMESAAITTQSFGWLLAVLLVLFALLRGFSLSRHRLMPVDFDEVPATTQKLGLHT
jgi:hypothetical protein